ncbi:MAG TPA: DEAD/DEAH box helicase [Saprospiraceae bacterium]|nr:DEAD/DEAH box helicase [Saprospiraceae bacterium]HMQ81734.1 DEAD/DEAH box helicase [Saprospiraceae bacterium]
MNSFQEIGLKETILQAIKDLGFETPTPIQAKAIPHLLASNQDLIASAQTGTGKTAAFGLPAIHRTDASDKSTQTLVLSPTRELCLQITNDLINFAKYCPGIQVVPVYGGANISTQIKALSQKAQIVVATPGRARDLINRKKLQLNNVSCVVLDEADEMLSMGFKEDLEAILAEVPEERQTVLFSATMSREVAAITKNYMTTPIEISVAPVNSGAENVKHLYYLVRAEDRYELLKRIADINPNIYGIVFCRTRRETKEIANKLMQDGYNADALHGDLSQTQRDEVMNRFRIQHLQLLVATDVAARGLDVNDLTHVINYNLPDDSEVYIHRSGRTGRAGKSGESIAIIHSREKGKIKEIEKKAGISFTREMAPSGKDICTKQLFILIDKIEKVQVDEQQIGPFLPTIYKKLEWLSREDLIKHFVSAEFNRFLDYYKNSKDINVVELQKGAARSADKPAERRREDRGKVSFTRLYINLGSKNDINPARLIGLINEAMDSKDAKIGKIEIMKNFSIFGIENSMAVSLMQALKGAKFGSVAIETDFAKDKPADASNAKEGFSGFKKPKKKAEKKPFSFEGRNKGKKKGKVF